MMYILHTYELHSKDRTGFTHGTGRAHTTIGNTNIYNNTTNAIYTYLPACSALLSLSDLAGMTALQYNICS